jgi:hypothetical protein
MVTRKWESRHRHRPMVGEKSVRIGLRGRPTGLRSAPTGARPTTAQMFTPAALDSPHWRSSRDSDRGGGAAGGVGMDNSRSAGAQRSPGITPRGGRHGVVAATTPVTSVTSPDSITAPVRHREAVTSGRSDLAPAILDDRQHRESAPTKADASSVREVRLRGSGGAVAAVCARRIREGTQGSRQPGCAEPGSGLPRYEIGSAARRYAAPWERSTYSIMNLYPG